METNEEKMLFKVIDESGKEIECEGLFSFESEETNKNYLVYTDNSVDEDGNTRVYAAIYHPDKKEGVLEPIETDAELAIVENVLNEFSAQANDEKE